MSSPADDLTSSYDVLVVGGGAAGLSAALALSRARRSVLVVDAGDPRNLGAGHVHNYLGREGTPPAELLAIGRREVTSYGGEVVSGRVTEVKAHEAEEPRFTVRLEDGREVESRRVVVATGLADELPGVPGLKERWGRDVLHCPYCHGWEVRDQAIGVIGSNAFALHQALMFRQWSDDVMLFLNGGPAPTEDAAEQLSARGIPVVDEPLDEVMVDDDRVVGLRLTTGEVVAREALVVFPRAAARDEVLASLGIRAVEQEVNGVVVGSLVAADAAGATAVPGVWVAGNVTDVRAQVISAAAAGLNVGAMVNHDLVMEETRLAVAARRDMMVMFEQPSWEERYRSRSHLWSGRPNAQLVAEVAALPPGSALDVGCGEGADAIWLAGEGWRVTAVDFSAVALQRAAEHAPADLAVAWEEADLREWSPDGRTWDLVSSQFLHLPGDDMARVVGRMAEAVAPGGTLLIVGHHPSDLRTGLRWNVPDVLFTAGQAARRLDPEAWDVVVAEARPRQTSGHDGEPVTVHDSVLRARRR